MLRLKSILRKKKSEEHLSKEKDYPNKKCPFCGEKNWLAKHWARFPNRCLQKRKKGVIPLLTGEAEQEWFDFILCLKCLRIIWHQLDPHGNFVDNIDLPTIKELTGWKDLPYTPVVFYDKEGNPVYGTKRSREMYK